MSTRFLIVSLLFFACFQITACARITSSNGTSGQSDPDCALPSTCRATLTWDPSDTSGGGGTPAGYRVYYGTSSGGYTTSVDTMANLTHSITSFMGPQTYYFSVTAYNGAGESPYSSEVSRVFPACCTGGTFILNTNE